MQRLLIITVYDVQGGSAFLSPTMYNVSLQTIQMKAIEQYCRDVYNAVLSGSYYCVSG